VSVEIGFGSQAIVVNLYDPNQLLADGAVLAAAVSGKADLDGGNLSAGQAEDFRDAIGAAALNLSNAELDGSPITVSTSGSYPDESIVGFYVQATNSSNNRGYSGSRWDYTKTGAVLAGNDIAHTKITRYNDIRGGSAWNKWEVIQSPLPVGSGLPGAPTVTQNFYITTREINAQNRSAQISPFRVEARSYPNPVLGDQFVPETQDFTNLLGTGNNSIRMGYNVVCSMWTSKSPYTDTNLDRHAQTLCPVLIGPNAIGFGGYAVFATGHRTFVKTVTIVNAGTGYAPGQILMANSGIFSFENEDFSVRVLTVGGGGAITSAELWTAGSYQSSFSNPVGVAGGTGSGATFSYTLSTKIDEQPEGWGGIGGDYRSGFNCVSIEAGYASFARGFVVVQNNQVIATSRNADDTLDVPLLKLNALDRVELGGKQFKGAVEYTPTITAEVGSITTISDVVGRWSIANGFMTLNVSFGIPTAGTAAQAMRVSLPAGFTILVGAPATVLRADNLSVLSGLAEQGQTYIRIASATGGNPFASGAAYGITATFEI